MSKDGRRIVLALQFWNGDKEAAMRNARRIADNEPSFRDDVEFCFVTRHGTEHDAAVMEYVSKKFRVSSFTSNRRGSGWPHACNETWCALMQESASRVGSGEWAAVKALFTFEADCIPVSRDWIQKLNEEWDATELLGKWICGWWHGSGSRVGHINGNALFHPSLAKFMYKVAGCPAHVAWDAHLAPDFEAHWRKGTFIENLYHQQGLPRETLERIVAGGIILVHGVKDLSVETYADSILRK